MVNILWVGDVGRLNSFSHITESMIPLMTCESNSIFLLQPQKTVKLPKTKSYYVGDSLSSGYNFIDFSSQCSLDDGVTLKMKYSIVQMIDISQCEEIDYIIIVMGIYEASWFMNILNKHKTKPKIIIWTPLDYIPTYSVVSDIIKADIVLTTTPNMSDMICNLSRKHDPQHHIENKFNWVNHGFRSKLVNTCSREESYNFLRSKFTLPMGVDDTIILNANSNVDRKQLYISIKLFQDLDTEGLYLWLHTKVTEKLLKMTKKNRNIIITHSGVDDLVLSHIYRLCQIGLQTSSGEGWSLTNCEHAKLGGVQVVPNFLATGFHFNIPGCSQFCYKVNTTTIKNEAGSECDIGIIDLRDGLKKLKGAIQLVKDPSLRCKYTESVLKQLDLWTWEGAAEKLLKLCKECNNE